jgi:hypothetical protein
VAAGVDATPDGALEAGDGPQQRGLPGAVRADDGQRRRRGQLQRGAAQGDEAVVADLDVLDGDGSVRGREMVLMSLRFENDYRSPTVRRRRTAGKSR